MRDILPEGTATVPYAYPRDLAGFLPGVWPDQVEVSLCHEEETGVSDPLPEPALLEKLLSTCFQASLLFDEGRPVNFRLILRAPDRFPEADGPPTGLHRLVFDRPFPFTPQELRRLAPAALFTRSLIGVTTDEEDGFHIWGIIHSGVRWMQEHHGGRRPSCPLPPSLVLQVTGPGVLSVSAGSQVVARLDGGRVLGRPINTFASKWLPALFGDSLQEIAEHHDAARLAAAQAGKSWGCVDPMVVRLVAQQMMKRLVATIRNSHHGGLLVILSPEVADRIEAQQHAGAPAPIRLKYHFRRDEARNRFRMLILSVLETLAEAHPDGGETQTSGPGVSFPESSDGWNRSEYPSEAVGDPDVMSPAPGVGWQEYQASTNRELAAADEAILEVAYAAAGMAAADGAVVMNKRFEMIGFGGEISSELPLVPAVTHALDVEAEETLWVTTDSVGTRHRAAYRLVNEIRDSLAVVISQDGEVRFVAWQNGAVTYWIQ